MGFEFRKKVPKYLCLALSGAVFAYPGQSAAQQAADGQGAASSAQAAPEQAPETFPIYAIDVSGVTKLDRTEIEKIIYRYTGPAKTNKDVEEARKAIQSAYTAKGYESVIVESPVQPREAFEAGVITIAVNEAPVTNVRVVGSKYHSAAVVRRQLSAITPGQPLNFKTLQTQFETAGRFPDRRIDFSPKPGEVPGTIDVDLNVKDKFPLHSTIELNNDNSPFTRPLRLSGAVRYTDLFGLGHTISANFIIAPQRKSDSSVVAGSYTAPILGTPWTLSVSGYRSNSNVAALGGTNVLGNGYQIGVRAAYRLPATKSFQTISAGFDYKDFKQNVTFKGADVGSTPIRYIPFVLDYTVAASDTDSKFAKTIGESTFDATIGVTAGLRAIKRQVCIETATNQLVSAGSCKAGLPGFVFNDQFRNSALDSSESFVHFNAGFDWSLATKSDFLLTTAWQVQVADVHLVTNEQFGAGGQGTVRGYYQSEEVGDEGFTSSFEIASPSAAQLLGKSVDDLRAFGFVDTAFVRTLSPTPGQRNNVKLIGVGGGARAKIFNRLFGEIVVGVPLNAGSTSIKGDTRTVFVVRGEF